MSRSPGPLRVTTRNARFQRWQALLTNRAQRTRHRELVVQGVRPITLAVRYGWEIRTLLYHDGVPRSEWATGLLDTVPAERVAVAGELLRELGGKPDTTPELLAVVGMPPDDLSRIPAGRRPLVVGLDRPASPGNLGTVIRSADAFGAAGVVVAGHAADVYDPRTVRASTGSLFAVPVVRVASHRPARDWAAGAGLDLVGLDEAGPVPLAGCDLRRPTLLLAGTEAARLSAGWREACHRIARIPLTGAASSLNLATAVSVALYECARQRGTADRVDPADRADRVDPAGAGSRTIDATGGDGGEP